MRPRGPSSTTAGGSSRPSFAPFQRQVSVSRRSSPSRVLTAWLDHLQVERGVSPHTQAAYERDVRTLLEGAGIRGDAMEREGALEDLTRDDIVTWLPAQAYGP